MTQVFDAFYTKSKWRGGLEDGTRSGAGSTLAVTQAFREFLAELIREHNVASIFDAPCGDFHWMKEVPLPDELSYLGGDVAASLVDELNQKYRRKNVTFRHFDIVNDEFPAADLWICRDCFIHLPRDYCIQALRGAAKADIKYVILTSYYELKLNLRGELGGARGINLLLPPFGLPQPIARVDELVRDDGRPTRFQGLWTMADVRAALARS